MTTSVAAWLLSLLLALQAAAQETPSERVVHARLSLRSSRPVGPKPERVRCGIPLPESANLRDPSALRLETPTGRAIPARLVAASRWRGTPEDADRPIKWLHATLAAVPGLETVELVEGRPPKGDLTLDERDGTIRIDTGQGETVLISGKSVLMQRTCGVDHAPAGFLVAVDEKDRTTTASPWKLVVESAHHTAATILATCTLFDLDIELRLRFVAGVRAITADFRVVNPGPYGHFGRPASHAYFKRLGLTLPRVKDATHAAMPGVETTLAAGVSLSLVQSREVPAGKSLPAERLPYEVWKGRRRLRAGRRSVGVAVTGGGGSDGGDALGLMVERFWQNAPKALSVHDEVVVLDLFPEGAGGPVHRGQYGTRTDGPVDVRSTRAHRFEGARAKTTRFVLAASESSATALRDELLARVDRALHATPSPTDIIATGAVGYPFVAAGRKDRASARFDRLLRTFVDDSAADPQPSLGAVGLTRFMERGGTYGEQVFYGWFHFGDIAWGDGFCSLHYDWPFVMLLSYLRTGDVRFFERGRDMVRHRVDIDQDHDRLSDVRQRGGQFYEKGFFHGNYYHPSASHTWAHGPILWHLLTGDETALEAARLNGEFLRRTKGGRWDGKWGSRDQGWSADNFVSLWWAYGRKDDLKEAERHLADFEAVETRVYGGRGYVVNEAMNPPSMKPWMHDIVLNAAARHAWLTGSKRFHPLMDRMQAFLIRHALLPAKSGQPRMVKRNLHPKTGHVDGASHHLLWPMAASFALCWLATGDETDRELAASLFENAILFHQGKAGAPLSFRMTAYPGSESKILSNIGLWGLPAQISLP